MFSVILIGFIDWCYRIRSFCIKTSYIVHIFVKMNIKVICQQLIDSCKSINIFDFPLNHTVNFFEYKFLCALYISCAELWCDTFLKAKNLINRITQSEQDCAPGLALLLSVIQCDLSLLCCMLYTYIKHNCSHQHCPVTQCCCACRFIA